MDELAMTTGKAKWDQLAPAWRHATVPAAPSKDDLRAVTISLKEFQKTHSMSEIALLGSTTGVRDVLRKFGKKIRHITLVDTSTKMLATSFEILPRSINEHICECDWQQFGSVLSDSFDVIIGDKVFDNVPFAHWSKFIRSVHKSLRSNGLFITRLGLQNRRLALYSLKQGIFRWSKSESTLGRDVALSAFWEELLGASAFEGGGYSHIQTVARYKQRLKSFVASAGNGPEREFTLAFLDRYNSTLDFEWTSYSWKDFESAIRLHFEVGSRLTSTDYAAAKRQPTILLKRLSCP